MLREFRVLSSKLFENGTMTLVQTLLGSPPFALQDVVAGSPEDALLSDVHRFCQDIMHPEQGEQEVSSVQRQVTLLLLLAIGVSSGRISLLLEFVDELLILPRDPANSEPLLLQGYPFTAWVKVFMQRMESYRIDYALGTFEDNTYVKKFAIKTLPGDPENDNAENGSEESNANFTSSLAMDGSFAYTWSLTKGLAKIGTGHNFTIAGRVYAEVSANEYLRRLEKKRTVRKLVYGFGECIKDVSEVARDEMARVHDESSRMSVQDVFGAFGTSDESRLLVSYYAGNVQDVCILENRDIFTLPLSSTENEVATVKVCRAWYGDLDVLNTEAVLHFCNLLEQKRSDDVADSNDLGVTLSHELVEQLLTTSGISLEKMVDSKKLMVVFGCGEIQIQWGLKSLKRRHLGFLEDLPLEKYSSQTSGSNVKCTMPLYAYATEGKLIYEIDMGSGDIGVNVITPKAFPGGGKVLEIRSAVVINEDKLEVQLPLFYTNGASLGVLLADPNSQESGSSKNRVHCVLFDCESGRTKELYENEERTSCLERSLSSTSVCFDARNNLLWLYDEHKRALRSYQNSGKRIPLDENSIPSDVVSKKTGDGEKPSFIETTALSLLAFLYKNAVASGSTVGNDAGNDSATRVPFAVDVEVETFKLLLAFTSRWLCRVLAPVVLSSGVMLLRDRKSIKDLLMINDASESIEPESEQISRGVDGSTAATSSRLFDFLKDSSSKLLKFMDKSQGEYYGSQFYSGRDSEQNWPGVGENPPLIIESDHCFVYFHTDGSNTDWGYKFTATAEILERKKSLQQHWIVFLLESVVHLLDESIKILVDGSAFARIDDMEVQNEQYLQSDLLRSGVCTEDNKNTEVLRLLQDFVDLPESSDAEKVIQALQERSAAIFHHNMWGMDAYAFTQNLRYDISEQLLRGWKNAQKMRDWFHLGDAADAGMHGQTAPSRRRSGRLRRQPSAYKGLSEESLAILCDNVIKRARFLLEITPVSFAYVTGAKRRWGLLAKYGHAIGKQNCSDFQLDKWYNLLDELQAATELRSLFQYRRSSSERLKHGQVKSVTEQVLEFIQSDVDISEVRKVIEIRNRRAASRALGMEVFIQSLKDCSSLRLRGVLLESFTTALKCFAIANSVTNVSGSSSESRVLPQILRLLSSDSITTRNAAQSLLGVLLSRFIAGRVESNTEEDGDDDDDEHAASDAHDVSAFQRQLFAAVGHQLEGIVSAVKSALNSAHDGAVANPSKGPLYALKLGDEVRRGPTWSGTDELGEHDMAATKPWSHFGLFLTDSRMLVYKIACGSDKESVFETDYEMDADQWSHVAIVQDEDILRVYVNGSMVSQHLLESFLVMNANVNPGESAIIESTHPLEDTIDEYCPVHIPGAVKIRLTFDPLCDIDGSPGLCGFKRREVCGILGRRQVYWQVQRPGAEFSWCSKQPRSKSSARRCINADLNVLEIPSDRFLVYFHNEGSSNSWGFRILASPELATSEEECTNPVAHLNPYPFYFGESPGRVLDEPAAKCWIYQPKVLNYPISESDLTTEIQTSFPSAEIISNVAPAERTLHILGLIRTCAETSFGRGLIGTPENLQNILLLSFDDRVPVEIRIGAIKVLKDLAGILGTDVMDTQVAKALPGETDGFLLCVFKRLGRALNVWREFEEDKAVVVDGIEEEDAGGDLLELRTSAQGEASLVAAYISLLRGAAEFSCWGDQVFELVIAGLQSVQTLQDKWSEREVGQVLASLALLGGNYGGAYIGGRVSCCVNVDNKEMVETGYLVQFRMKSGTQIARVIFDCDQSNIVDVPLTDVAHLDDIEKTELTSFLKRVTPFASELKDLYQGVLDLTDVSPSVDSYQPKLTKKENVEVLESEHPYAAGEDVTYSLNFRGATEIVIRFDKMSCTAGPNDYIQFKKKEGDLKEGGGNDDKYWGEEKYYGESFPGWASTLTITFDPQSRTEQGCDYLSFFKDKSLTDRWGAYQYCGVGSDANWPGVEDRPPLVIPADSFTLLWATDGSNVDWGWKFNVTAEFLPEFPLDKSLKQLDARSYRLFETLYEKMSHQRAPLKGELKNLLEMMIHARKSTAQIQFAQYFRVADEDGIKIYQEKNRESSVLAELGAGTELTAEVDLDGWLKVSSDNVDQLDKAKCGWIWQRTGDTVHVSPSAACANGEDLLTLGVDDLNFESRHSVLEMDERNDEEKSLTSLCSPFAFDEFKGQTDRIQSLAYDSHRAVATKAAREAILTFLSCDPKRAPIPLSAFGTAEDILLLLSHFFFGSDSDATFDNQSGVLLALRKRLQQMVLSGVDDVILSAVLVQCLEIMKNGPQLLPKGRGAVQILESTHPYQDNADQYWDVSIPGATKIKIKYVNFRMLPVPDEFPQARVSGDYWTFGRRTWTDSGKISEFCAVGSSGKLSCGTRSSASGHHDFNEIHGNTSRIREGDTVVILVDLYRQTLAIRKNSILAALVAGPAGSGALVPWDELHPTLQPESDIRLVVSHSGADNRIEFSSLSCSPLALIPQSIVPSWYGKVVDAVSMMLDFRENLSLTVISRESRHPLASSAPSKPVRELIDINGAVALEIRFDKRTKLQKSDELHFYGGPKSETSEDGGDPLVVLSGINGEQNETDAPHLFAVDGTKQRNYSLSVGDLVVRSHDWEYSDEDGGAGNVGIVQEITSWGSHGGKGVRVRWQENGFETVYRYGLNARYDVQNLELTKYQSAPLIIRGSAISYEFVRGTPQATTRLDLSTSSEFTGSLELDGSMRLDLKLVKENERVLSKSDCSVEFWAFVSKDVFDKVDGNAYMEVLRIDGARGRVILLSDRLGRCTLALQAVDTSAFCGHLYDIRLWDVAFRVEQLRSHFRGLDSVDVVPKSSSRPGTPTSASTGPLSPSMIFFSSPRSPRSSLRPVAVPHHMRKWVTANRTSKDISTVRLNCCVKASKLLSCDGKPSDTAYYEAHALSSGKLCVGWILGGVNMHSKSAMIGEERNSFGIDLGKKVAHLSTLTKDLAPFTRVEPSACNSPRRSFGSSFGNDIFCRNGDVIGCAIDLATGKLTFYVNGTMVAECVPSEDQSSEVELLDNSKDHEFNALVTEIIAVERSEQITATSDVHARGVERRFYPSASLGPQGAQGLAWNFGQRPFKYEPNPGEGDVLSLLQASDCAEEDAYFEVYEYDEQQWDRVVYRHKVQEITPRLVGWWKLNEGVGNSVDDASGNSQQGLLAANNNTLIKYINKKGQSKVLNATQLLHGPWSDIAPQENELVRWPALMEIVASAGDEAKVEKNASKPTDSSRSSDTEASTKPLVDAHGRLSKRFKVLQEFNAAIHRILPFIAFHAPRVDTLDSSTLEKKFMLSDLVMEQRHRILSIVKRTVWDSALGRTNESGVSFELTLNRPKAMRFRATGKTDVEGRHTLFSQAFRQLQALDGTHFRREDALYHVTFLGENAQDAGGPYRETFAQYCEELQSTQLPLMLPTPNSQHNVGVGREKWLLSPGAQSSTTLQMLEFLGKLMGASIRSKQYFALNLAPLVWKKLAGERLVLDDLAAVDSMLVNSMSRMRTIDHYGVTEEMFEDIVMETFTTLGADNQVIELKPGGAHLPVTFSSRCEYADLVEQARLHESDDQAQAIFRGLAKVVPAKLLACFSGAELELMVCGLPEVDVNLLEKCTEYSSCSPTDDHIIWFWRALRDFSHEERSAFLRFVWGRSRLPASADEFPQRFKLQSFNMQRAGRSVDAYMPVAHTCFFSIEIPAYSSESVLREKLLYAIYNCQEIDGDGDSVAANQLGWEE
ncbi:Concanavalin A-like lectin/glucanase domain [Phytophthora cactorum]|nr:Concanavalin A-like lectin/glucanase domain [Phytophthora cactorum]